MPYATPTPLPEYLNVPDAIVIDSDGNVTLNDASVIEGDFQSARDQEEQTEYRSLSLGNTGIAVQALQLRLKDLGYFNGDVSGLFDADTEAAVKRFEQTYGTMQTGVATAKLQLKLFAATAPAYGTEEYNAAVISQYTVLRPGTVGSSVYALQQRLKNLDYPITELTGVFDEQTGQCVRLFYAAYGLASSDVANVAMQRELYADTAKTYDPSVQVLTTMTPDEEGQQAAIVTRGRRHGPTTTRAIALGNSGTRISQIQQRLIALGYMAEGGDTGVFDQATQEGVNRFLSAIGLAPNGMLTTDMQEFLLSENAPAFGGEAAISEYQNLNVGDSGEAVMNLQRRLVELGYANGTPNGEYGQATISAVAFYQQCNGMEPDGLATVWLQAVLFSDQALTYEQTQGLQPVASAEPTTPEPHPPEARHAVLQPGGGLHRQRGGGAAEPADRAGLPGRPADLRRGHPPRRSAFQSAIGVTPTGEASASMQRYVYSKAAPGPTVRFYNIPQAFQPLPWATPATR